MVVVLNKAELMNAYARYRTKITSMGNMIAARLGNIALDETVKEASEMVWQGTLVSGISMVSFGGYSFSVVSTAPHTKFVHDGVRTHWVSRESLNGWMESKGLPGHGVVVARPGTKLSKGLHFMLKGFKKAISESDEVVREEMLKNFGG